MLIHRLRLTTLLVLVAAPGAVAQGWLGVFLDPAAAGAVVVEVVPGSPAAVAGLRVGDVITRVDGAPVPDAPAFAAALRPLQAGAKPRLQLLRAGAALRVDVPLVPRPGGEQPAPAPPPQPEPPGRERRPPPAPGGGGGVAGGLPSRDWRAELVAVRAELAALRAEVASLSARLAALTARRQR